MTYSDKLKDPRWQKKRLEILERDNFTCRCCEDKTSTLHVHHSYYINGNDPFILKKENDKYIMDGGKARFNPLWHYFFPYLMHISEDELNEYHCEFLPAAIKKYCNG